MCLTWTLQYGIETLRYWIEGVHKAYNMCISNCYLFLAPAPYCSDVLLYCLLSLGWLVRPPLSVSACTAAVLYIWSHTWSTAVSVYRWPDRVQHRPSSLSHFLFSDVPYPDLFFPFMCFISLYSSALHLLFFSVSLLCCFTHNFSFSVQSSLSPLDAIWHANRKHLSGKLQPQYAHGFQCVLSECWESGINLIGEKTPWTSWSLLLSLSVYTQLAQDANCA